MSEKLKISQVTLTEEALDQIKNIDWEKVREEERIAQEKWKYDNRHQHRDKNAGTCNCGGLIVADQIWNYSGYPNHPIIGPGSRDQIRMQHNGYYCRKCGLKYKFIVNEKHVLTNEQMDEIFGKG